MGRPFIPLLSYRSSLWYQGVTTVAEARDVEQLIDKTVNAIFKLLPTLPIGSTLHCLVNGCVNEDLDWRIDRAMSSKWASEIVFRMVERHIQTELKRAPDNQVEFEIRNGAGPGLITVTQEKGN